MTWPRWWACTAATPDRQHRGHRDGQADLHDQRRRRPRTRAWRRSSASARRPSSSTASSAARVGAERQQLGRARASASTTWAESAPESAADLVVAAARAT